MSSWRAWLHGALVALIVCAAAGVLAQQPVTVANSPTVSSNQGTAAAAANRWPMYLSDGTNTMPTGDAAARTIHTTIDNAALTVTGTFWQATQPISGTVTANQGTPTNWATNVAQLAGTATSVNSGVKDAGTLRVVLATDQPQLTSKLLVTPDSVALPANQSVNVAQIAGTATSVNNGTVDAGTQRHAVASNNSAIALWGHGATGAAPPANVTYVGGLQSGATGGLLGGIAVADTFKGVNVSTATTTLLVTGVSGRQVRVSSFHLVTAAANNVQWISGTGATCGTGTTGIGGGGTTAASGYNFAANGGIAVGNGLGQVFTTTATGDSLCLVTSAATQLSGVIAYSIY